MRKTCSQQSHERNLRTLEKEIGLEERRNKGDIEIFFFQYQGIDFISNIEGSMLYGWIFTWICQKDVTVNIINIQISNISVCLNDRGSRKIYITSIYTYNCIEIWCFDRLMPIYPFVYCICNHSCRIIEFVIADDRKYSEKWFKVFSLFL